MTIGERIRTIRKAKGLTQKDLAVLSGTSEITVRQYETGKRQPRIEQLILIADALGVSSGELIGVDDSPYDKFEEINKILRYANVSYESSDIFDDYYVWPTDSEHPMEDRIEITFKELSEIVLGAQRESEIVKQAFLKRTLYIKLFGKNPDTTPTVPTRDTGLEKKVAALEQKNQELEERLGAMEKEDAEQETVETVSRSSSPSQFR